MNKYSVVKSVGEGSFAQVVLARCSDNSSTVAIKIFKPLEAEEDSVYIKKCVTREIAALRKVRHRYTINLIETFYDGRETLHMVFEYLPSNLLEALRQSRVTPDNVESVMFQLCSALEACHSSGVLHRDVKPDNILVNADMSLVKLCDFGIARDTEGNATLGVGNKSEPLTEYVSTRWYRAPELLFSGNVYGSKVDMWAAGCVGAELLMGSTLFAGDSELAQLESMMSTLGTEFGSKVLHHIRHSCVGVRFLDQTTNLDRLVLKAFEGQLVSSHKKQQLDQFRKKTAGWRKSFTEGILANLLSLDPETRISAKEAIRDNVFAKYLKEDPSHGKLSDDLACNSMKLVDDSPTPETLGENHYTYVDESDDALEETIEEDDDEVNNVVVVVEDATAEHQGFVEEELSDDSDDEGVVIAVVDSVVEPMHDLDVEDHYSEDSDHADIA